MSQTQPGKSPKTVEEQDQPEPERPVLPDELRRQETPMDKPSQAEGEREVEEEDERRMMNDE